jgi:hypothetical protein
MAFCINKSDAGEVSEVRRGYGEVTFLGVTSPRRPMKTQVVLSKARLARLFLDPLRVQEKKVFIRGCAHTHI